MEMYSHLNQPITIKSMTVKNRIFLPPMKMNSIDTHLGISDSVIQYYENIARGGAGLITTEAVEVDSEHLYSSTILGIFSDSQIEGFRRIAAAVHRHGAKLSVQLIQGGSNSFSFENEGRMPLACSPIAHPYNPTETPIEMTHADIDRCKCLYAAAGARAKQSGCDAVEIHCAHIHALLGGFLSPIFNHRTDEYGGDLNGRTRLLIEVYQAIRCEVGDDFPISVRLSVDEMEEGGNNVYDMAYVARLLEKAGVDYIHFSAGSLFDFGTLVPPAGKSRAVNAELTDIIKRYVKIPIGGVGRIKEPWVADLLIEQGRLDFVYIGRPQISDPDYVNKSLFGDFEDVRPCIGCLQCIAANAFGIPLRCTMNPGILDNTLYNFNTAKVKKKVVIVGGGPAGLEAAATASKRGHAVILLEKSSKLGGQFIIASYPPVKQELSIALKWMIREVTKAGAEIRLNTEATVEMVKALAPDDIVIATGGCPIIPKWIAASNHPKIVTSHDILSGIAIPGANIVIIGGGAVGCEVAEFLAPRHDFHRMIDRKVTLIEMLDNVDIMDFTSNRDYMMARLKEKPITIHTSARVLEVSSNSVTYQKGNESETITGVDTIVVAIGTHPVNSLAEELRNSGIPIHLIGDASEAGKVIDAISSGRRIGMNL